tara:strand:- start:798 stop:1187 length:390 start_codon:yes stop_codon:yes gene_type:complete
MPIQKNNDYCVHGQYVGNLFTADYMCHMCEDGYLYRKECNECDLSFWARSNDTIKHHAGNPQRAKFAEFVRLIRKDFISFGFRSEAKKRFKNDYQLFRESFAKNSQSLDLYSRYLGNFESKNLHSLSEV